MNKNSDTRGFRLNEETDLDIISDLNKYANKTKRIKEMYRKAMQLERGVIELLQRHEAGTEAPEIKPSHNINEASVSQEHKASLDWTKSFPKERTVNQDGTEDKAKGGAIKSKLLQNNF